MILSGMLTQMVENTDQHVQIVFEMVILHQLLFLHSLYNFHSIPPPLAHMLFVTAHVPDRLSKNEMVILNYVLY